MARTDTDELIEDAEIEGLPGPSRWWGFVRGLALGLVSSAAVALGLTLSHPLPDNLPGVGTVQVEDDAIAGRAPAGEQGATGSGDATQAASGSGAASAGSATDADNRNDDGDGDGDTNADAGSDPEPVASTQEQDDTALAAAPGADDTDPSVQASSDAESSDSAISDSETSDSPTQTLPEDETAEDTAAAPTDDTPPAASEDTANGDTANEDPAETPQIAAVTPVEPVEPVEAEPQAAVRLEPVPLEPVPEIALAGPALEINARPFQAPQTVPLLAVIVDDAGNGSIEADALSLLTMPLTLSISPEGPESAALAEAARAASHEVLVRLPFSRSDAEVGAERLHAGLSTAQTEALTTRSLALFPVALGATPPDGATLLRDRDAMAAVIAPVQAHGFAWVDLTAGSGSTVASLASDGGVPFAETGRAIDEGASDDQIFNGLEAAAFQARQRGTAIVRIPASPEALTALLRWGLERDRRPVWFAPVSAVLKRRAGS